MSSRHPEFLDDLERQFAELSAGEAAGRRRRRHAGRAGLAVAAVGLCLASAGAVAAVTGLIDISGDRSAGLVGLADRAGIASGTASSDRTWLLSTARNGPHTCLALKIESASRLLGTSEICGGIELGQFNAGTAPQGSSRPLLFGTLPEDVDRVRLVDVDVDVTETSARAIDGPAGLAGRFFVVELPTADPRGVRVELLRAEGELARGPIPLLQLLRTSIAPVSPPSAD